MVTGPPSGTKVASNKTNHCGSIDAGIGLENVSTRIHGGDARYLSPVERDYLKSERDGGDGGRVNFVLIQGDYSVPIGRKEESESILRERSSSVN